MVVDRDENHGKADRFMLQLLLRSASYLQNISLCCARCSKRTCRWGHIVVSTDKAEPLFVQKSADKLELLP